MAIMTEDEEKRFNNKTMTQDELNIINSEINSGIRKSDVQVITKRLSDSISVIGSEECVQDITLETMQNLDIPSHLVYRG